MSKDSRLKYYSKSILTCLGCILMAGIGMAQQTILYEDAERKFEEMVKEFDQGLYGRAARSAEAFLSAYQEPSYSHLILEAELYQLRSWLRMGQPGTIQKVMLFANQHQPDPVAQKAIMMIGEHAYEEKRYDEAIKYLSLVDARVLSNGERSALYFKLGYSLFVREEFGQAARMFKESREVRDKYYYPSNYYYGMTQYFEGNYEEAISSFERVVPSEYYKDFIPYYITQIYFNNQDFSKVIDYGNYALSSPTVQNKTELRHLIGQAYFETGDYESALPHLEYVEKNSAKLRPDDFYQLGLAYYNASRYSDAIPVLLQIRNEKGVKSHYANYYLGRSYLMIGDKTSARNSLRNAMIMQDVPVIATEATFHYGKLSAEAGDDIEAIRVLQTIPLSSPDYQESQIILAGILTNTSDFSLAIRELEAMKTLTPALKGAYQKVTLLRAEQLIQEGKMSEAKTLLDKSLRNNADPVIEARAFFWLGELAHLDERYQESIQSYTRYFSLAKKAEDFPAHQTPSVAHYNQGYNYLKLHDYVNAQKEFEAAVNGIKELIAPRSETTFLRNQLLPEALLRAGDASFKRNQYDKAILFYDQSISGKLPGYDYAMFQKALIKGLQKKTQEKITLLEQIANNIPESLWADDALMQAGITYQEDNKSDKAITSYERIVNLKTRSPLLHPALLRLGLLSYNDQKFEASLKYYKSIFEYNPDPQTAKEAMSAIQEIYVNEIDKPEAFFEFASTVPGYSVSGSERDSILYAAAENHYALGLYEKAAESFKNYIEQLPRGVYVQKAKFLRAESLSLAKKWEDALTAYEVVIKGGPGPYLSTSLYKAALIAYNQREDMHRAYIYYSDYIPLAESEEKQFESILGALRSAYKLKKADDVYKMAGTILEHPRVTDDIRALAYYYTATMAQENDEYEEAISAYNNIIKINSSELAAESRYAIAVIYEKRGQTELAEKLAEESARSNVGYPLWVAKSLLLLSDIQYKKGDLLNAKAIVEAIIENFREDPAIIKEAQERLVKIKSAEQDQSRIKTGGDSLELLDPSKKD